jgi:hypothetical protein
VAPPAGRPAASVPPRPSAVDPAAPRDEEATPPHVPPEEVAPGDVAAPGDDAALEVEVAVPGRARRRAGREASPPLRPEGARRRARRRPPSRLEQSPPLRPEGGEAAAAQGGSPTPRPGGVEAAASESRTTSCGWLRRRI